MKRDPFCHLLDDYLHNLLEPDANEQFAAHLDQCTACSDDVSNWQSISESLQDSFASLHLPNEHRKLLEQDATLNQHPWHWIFAMAATALLAGTAAISWFLAEDRQSTTDSVGGSSAQHPVDLPESVPIIANAKFDEQTIAVLECDDDELTVYRVFPKVTLRTLE